MFTVANAAGVLIAKFRTEAQIEAWAKRVGIIMENVTVRHRPDLINDNEWIREDYR